MADSLTIPAFEPEDYFSGQLDAYGVFVDRFGTIQRQFEVVVEGRKTDTGFSLDEYFLYDDGQREERRWDVSALGNGRYEGRCRDVIGVARGVRTANMLSWKYRFRLEMFGRKVAVTFDDVMVLQAGGVLVNRATVSKAGLKLGEVLITFRPS